MKTITIEGIENKEKQKAIKIDVNIDGLWISSEKYRQDPVEKGWYKEKHFLFKRYPDKDLTLQVNYNLLAMNTMLENIKIFHSDEEVASIRFVREGRTTECKSIFKYLDKGEWKTITIEVTEKLSLEY